MANAIAKLYNFYKRYKWRAADFTGWQQGMIDYARGLQEGTFGAAVLSGYAPALVGGMNIDVAVGIACGPTGNFMASSGVASVTITAPGSDFERDLVVVRPDLVDSDFITRPTSPSDVVPLTTIQGAMIALIRGTAGAVPTYPAKQPNDTVLFGVRVKAGQSSLAAGDIDLDVRDIPGKNSNFQQDFGRYDDRLRVYLGAAPVVGIKPSQLEPPLARVFSYISRKSPSIYPKAGGLYNPVDTFVNMRTGAISGGDATSPALTPVIPSAGNAVVATLSITTADILVVAYGTPGTRAQCYAGIKSQIASPTAGSVGFTANSKPIAFLIVFSADGTNVTELDLFDARSLGGVGDNDAANTAALSTILVTTGDTTSGSASITNLASIAGLKRGMGVSGTGIPAGAFINSVSGPSTVNLNTPATASGTTVALTFAHTIATDLVVQGQLDALDGLLNAVQKEPKNIAAQATDFYVSVGDTSSGNATVTGLGTTAGLLPGMQISGSYVRPNTFVKKILSGTSIEMSKVALTIGGGTFFHFNHMVATGTDVQSQLDELDAAVNANIDNYEHVTVGAYTVDPAVEKSGKTLFCDSSGGVIQINLPTPPNTPNGYQIRIQGNKFTRTSNITVHRTSGNINGVASDFFIDAENACVNLQWSRADNSWFTSFFQRQFIGQAGTAANPTFSFENGVPSGMFLNASLVPAISDNAVEAVTMGQAGISTADDLASPIKWKVFTGTLTTNTNISLPCPGSVVLGAVGMDTTNHRPIYPVNYRNISTDAVGSPSSEGLEWLASADGAHVDVRNSFTSGTHTLGYRVVMYYQ